MSQHTENLAVAKAKADERLAPSEEITIDQYLQVVQQVQAKNTKNLRADQCLTILRNPDWNRIELLLLDANLSISPAEALNEAASLLDDVQFAQYCCAFTEHHMVSKVNRDELACVLGARHDMLLQSSDNYSKGIAHLDNVVKVFDKAKKRRDAELQRQRRDEDTIKAKWGADWVEKVTNGHSFQLAISRNTRQLIKKYVESDNQNLFLFSEYLQRVLATRMNANLSNFHRGGHRRKVAGPADIKNAITMLQEVRGFDLATPTPAPEPANNRFLLNRKIEDTRHSPIADFQAGLRKSVEVAPLCLPTKHTAPESNGQFQEDSPPVAGRRSEGAGRDLEVSRRERGSPSEEKAENQQEVLSESPAPEEAAGNGLDASDTGCSPDQQQLLSERPASGEAEGNGLHASDTSCSPDQQENLSESPAPEEALGNVDGAVGSSSVNLGADGQPDVETGRCGGHTDTSGAKNSVVEGEVDLSTTKASFQDTTTSDSADVEPSGTIKTTSTDKGELKPPGLEEAEASSTSSQKSGSGQTADLEDGSINNGPVSVEQHDAGPVVEANKGLAKTPEPVDDGDTAEDSVRQSITGEDVNLPPRGARALAVIIEKKTRPTVGSKDPRKAQAESLPEMEPENDSASDDEENDSASEDDENDSASEDEEDEAASPVRRRQKSKAIDDRTYRAPGRRPQAASVSIPAWSKSIPMPTRDQLELALEQAIGRDTMQKLKDGERVRITLLEGTNPGAWHQGQFYAGHRSVHAFASMLVFARQDPVLWMVAAWVHRTFNVHAPPTDDMRTLDDDVSEDVSQDSDMTTLVAIVSPRASEPMRLPCGDVQWVVDNGTLDRRLLAEANREAFCLQRDGNTWCKASSLGEFFEEPWVSGHPLCAAMVGNRAWDDVSVSCAISRLLNPARGETEIRQIRRQNEEMMDGAAMRSICTDMQLRLDESYLASWLRQAPAELVDHDSFFYLKAAGELVSGPAAFPKIDFNHEDPALKAKVLAVIKSLAGDHRVSDSDELLPSVSLGDKRGNEQVDTPETPASKRLK